VKAKAEIVEFGDMQSTKERRFPSTLILICGMIASGIGFAALLGWFAGIPLLSSLESGRIPMAPSTALLFMLYGAGVLLLSRPSSDRVVFRISLVIGISSTMVALLLFILTFMGIHPDAEYLSLRIVGTINGAPIGHMSAVTAFCFVLAGLSFLASLSSSTGRTKAASAALWSSVLVVLSSLVLLLAYILGSPLLYGSSFIPPALPTSLGFLFLGTALLVYSGQRLLPHSSLSETADSRSAYALLAIFLLLVTGIVMAGHFYLRNYEKKYRLEVQEQLSSISSLKVDGLEHYRNERLEDAFLIFKTEVFSDLIRHFLANPGDAPGRKKILSWLEKLQTNRHYDQVQLMDAGGVTRLSVPAGARPVSSVIAKRVSDVLRTREVAFQDFYLNELDHRPYLSLIVPIIDTHGVEQVIGVVTLRIDPETHLYPYIKLWPASSITAETLLVRREGSDALFLNDLRFRKNTALSLRIPLEKKNVIAVQGVLGSKGILEGIDYNGVPVVADTRAVPGSPWVLITRINREEVNAPLRQQLWRIIALIGVLLVGAGSGVAFLWRQQHVRFYRKRYESSEELRKSEERYRVLFNAMDEGFCVVEMLYDPTGKAIDYRFLEINPAFEKQTGLQQVLGKTIRELVPNNEAYWFEIYGNVARTGEAIRFENLTQGLQKYFDIFAFRVGGDESRNVAILFKDITERKRVEAELHEKERLLSESQRLGHIGSFLYSKTGKLSWSEELYHLYGVSPETFTPTMESFLSLILPEDRPAMQAWTDACAAGAKPDALEFRINLPDGTIRYIRGDGDAVFDDKNRLIYLAGSAQDITEQKLAEKELLRYSSELAKKNAELRESEKEFRNLVEEAPLAISVVNKAGEIEYINKKNVEIIGYTRYETPTLESWWSLAYPDPEERKKITAVWGDIQHRVLSGENVGTAERMIICKDGTTKDVELRFSRAGGKILVIFNDITERKRAEKELQRYASELEKSNKELQEALVKVKTLSGMLPICASCKKIRDDKGYWSGVESYIARHSEVLFSHGICPECEKKMYEDLEKLKKEDF
jgi:PAS domain S-box-containing protein